EQRWRGLRRRNRGYGLDSVEISILGAVVDHLEASTDTLEHGDDSLPRHASAGDKDLPRAYDVNGGVGLKDRIGGHGGPSFAGLEARGGQPLAVEQAEAGHRGQGCKQPEADDDGGLSPTAILEVVVDRR